MPGTGHVHVRSLLITIPSSNRASGFATEQKHLAWEFRLGFLSQNPCLLSQHQFRESTISLFVKGSLVKTVSACSGTALVTAQLSTLWTGKKKMISELIRLSFLCLSLVIFMLWSCSRWSQMLSRFAKTLIQCKIDAYQRISELTRRKHDHDVIWRRCWLIDSTLLKRLRSLPCIGYTRTCFPFKPSHPE